MKRNQIATCYSPKTAKQLLIYWINVKINMKPEAIRQFISDSDALTKKYHRAKIGLYMNEIFAGIKRD
jgi:hypothetical protein